MHIEEVLTSASRYRAQIDLPRQREMQEAQSVIAVKEAPGRETKNVKTLTEDALKGIEKEINRHLEILGSHVAFRIDEETGRTVIQVIDTETKEVVRQIPPEMMLRLMFRMTQVLGALMDETV